VSDRHAFHHDLSEQIPTLRAFARTLARDASHADDLVQETLLKAWSNRDRYQAGTNLRAWLFTILRNTFYSEFRKRRREVEDVDGAYVGRLAEKPSQDDRMALNDFAAALARLPVDQREALVLVGATGLSYEEAAAIVGCAVGTVKSRVSRARARLTEMLEPDAHGADGAEARVEAALGAALTPGA
jgi:RNA polymerase sigma-70 factor (ECF subfamily)